MVILLVEKYASIMHIILYVNALLPKTEGSFEIDLHFQCCRPSVLIIN